jgi:hypothetical protein
MAGDRRWFIEVLCEVKYRMKRHAIVSIVISFRYASWSDISVDTFRDLPLRRQSPPWASLRKRGSLRWKPYVSMFLLLKFSCFGHVRGTCAAPLRI